jgi:hypothetical protein
MIWKITSALITAMLMLAPLGYFYHVANAQSFSKKSSTNCEGNVCHTTMCINNNCQTSVSNPAELLNSIKSHGLLSNSIQQLLNSSNPWLVCQQGQIILSIWWQYNYNYNSKVLWFVARSHVQFRYYIIYGGYFCIQWSNLLLSTGL